MYVQLCPFEHAPIAKNLQGFVLYEAGDIGESSPSLSMAERADEWAEFLVGRVPIPASMAS